MSNYFVSMIDVMGHIEPDYNNLFPTGKIGAIKHSIEKWEWYLGYVKSLPVGSELPMVGIDSCALCNLYYGGNPRCADCPISEIVERDVPRKTPGKRMDYIYCHNTPYEKLCNYFDNTIDQDVIGLIEDEIEFLKYVLDEYEK